MHQKWDIIDHNDHIKSSISGLMFLLPQTACHLLQVSLTIVHQCTKRGHNISQSTVVLDTYYLHYAHTIFQIRTFHFQFQTDPTSEKSIRSNCANKWLISHNR